jgi:cathepsin D
MFLALAACGSSRESGSGTTDAGAGGTADDATADQAADVAPGPPAIPLSSCIPTVYTAQATIGSQQFQLTLDTGSTTLGVASASCSTCTEATPKYKPGSSATDEHSTAMSVYGSGEWTGEIYQDSVALGSEAAVPRKFVAIDTQSGFFEPIHCDSKSGGFQGILGLAPAASALTGTSAFFDVLVAKQQVPNVFAMELCETGGTLWLGGYDPTFATAEPTYVPLSGFVSQLLYGVSLTSISVAGKSAPIASAGYTDSVVDTGTSQFIIPTAALNTISDAIASSPKFAEIFGADVGASFFATPNNCAPLSR